MSAAAATNPFVNGAGTVAAAAPVAEAPKKVKKASNSPLTAMEAIKRIERIFRRLSPTARKLVGELMIANDAAPS